MSDNNSIIRGLQSTLGRMEIALGAIQEAIVWVNEEATIIWCNKSFDSLVELPHISILGANLVEIFPLEEEAGPISSAQHPCQKLLHTSVLDEEIYFFRNRKKPVYLEISGNSSEMSSGEKFLVLIIRDISALKLSQQELRKAKETLEIRVLARTNELLHLSRRYENILNEAVDGIITIDQRGHIMSFNPAAERIFGYSEAEVLGKNVNILMPSPEREQHDRYIQNYLETGTKHIIGIGREVIGLCQDGTEVPLDLAVSESVEKGEKLFTGIVRDISARKEVEAAMREARYEAEKANRVKSDFLARMSHEIRTPMNAILGMAELLQESSLHGDQGKYVDILKSSSSHLLSIINDLLDLAKIEAGKFQLETVPFDLHQVFSDTYDIVSVAAQEKGLKLEFTIAPDTPVKLLGDPLRVKQILINIVGNATKFTDRGEVSFTVKKGSNEEITEDSPPKVNLQFEVRDTGIGIDEADLDLIFDSFTQTEHSSEKRVGGTGLGLAIARKLVSFMGGHLSVTSVLNQGSIFSFDGWFLIDERVRADDTAGVAALQPGFKADVPSREFKILLVEDSPDNRFLFEKFLQQLNCTIDFAEDGMAGFETFKSSHYDLVLMDIQMPILDGYSATKLIREHEQKNSLERTPIIALSAHAREEEKGESLKAGCDFHLSKPIGKNEFLRSICDVLSVDLRNRTVSEDIEPAIHEVQIDRFIEDLIPGFLNNRREDIKSLREAVETGDMQLLQRLGHTMKGTGAGYGFETISEIGEAIERASLQNDGDTISQLTQKLETYLDTLKVVFID